MHQGFILWFTGLSGAGKSTLAGRLSEEFRRRGYRVEVLDGDEVRTHLSKGLGFSKEDRDTNIRRIGFVAHLLARNGVIAITAAISPTARSAMRYAAGTTNSSRSTRSARWMPSSSVTSRDSTRRRWRARSRTSPASPIPMNRRRTPKSSSKRTGRRRTSRSPKSSATWSGRG